MSSSILNEFAVPIPTGIRAQDGEHGFIDSATEQSPPPTAGASEPGQEKEEVG